MLAIVPPSVWKRTTVGLSFPLILYATNGIMPIATVARHGYWWAAVLGVLAMGTPLWLVLRARARREPSALGATRLPA